MQKDYAEIFSLRGGSYDEAMRLSPYSRLEEFMQAIYAASILPGMIVADVPSGGGYLKQFLPQGVACLEHETCSSFHGDSRSQSEQLSIYPFPWETSTIDVLISLAGIHHQENKYTFFKEACRVVKPSGQMVISDVLEHSKVAIFLDQFIGANSSTGHEGMYLNQDTDQQIKDAGWVIENTIVNDFSWKFTSTQNMAVFCKKLFDLNHVSNEKIIQAIDQHLGILDLPGGLIGMCWQLKTITARKYQEL